MLSRPSSPQVAAAAPSWEGTGKTIFSPLQMVHQKLGLQTYPTGSAHAKDNSQASLATAMCQMLITLHVVKKSQLTGLYSAEHAYERDAVKALLRAARKVQPACPTA